MPTTCMHNAARGSTHNHYIHIYIYNYTYIYICGKAVHIWESLPKYGSLPIHGKPSLMWEVFNVGEDLQYVGSLPIYMDALLLATQIHGICLMPCVWSITNSKRKCGGPDCRHMLTEVFMLLLKNMLFCKLLADCVFVHAGILCVLNSHQFHIPTFQYTLISGYIQTPGIPDVRIYPYFLFHTFSLHRTAARTYQESHVLSGFGPCQTEH